MMAAGGQILARGMPVAVNEAGEACRTVVIECNEVSLPSLNTKPISKSKLGKRILNGRYYLSCWMAMA